MQYFKIEYSYLDGGRYIHMADYMWAVSGVDAAWQIEIQFGTWDAFRIHGVWILQGDDWTDVEW